MTAATATVDEIRAEVRAWLAEHWDPDLTVREWWARLADAGWSAPTWPREWGGLGLGRAEQIAVNREIADAGAIGGPAGLGMLLAAPTILVHGSDEQKARYLRPILDGTEAWCQLFSEPGAGSDLASLQCRAERDGDEWVVTGQKVWTSHGHLADLGMLIARTDPDLPKHQGITYFAIEMDQPGIEVRPLREMTGRALFNEVFLDGARVPDAARIGPLGGGWAVTNTTLAAERAGLGSGGGGGEGGAFPGPRAGMLDQPAGTFARPKGAAAATGALAGGASGLLQRIAEERGLSRDPLVRQQLAQLHILGEVGRWTTLRARGARGTARDVPGAPNLAKLTQSRIVRLTRDLGPALLGPAGALAGADAPHRGVVTEMTLFAPGPSIYGGTDEIQKNIIGERVLGFPKEPGPDKSTPFRELRVS